MSAYRAAVREAVRRVQAREAAVVRATYSHKVLYRGATERCYLGSRAECTAFAAAVGSCQVVPASAEEIETEARRQERWLPYEGLP